MYCDADYSTPTWNRIVYSDADYSTPNIYDRRSVSGTKVTLGGEAVSWASSTHRCGTLLTTEAEHVALGEGVKATLFTGVVLSSVCPEISGPCVRILEDNSGGHSVGQEPSLFCSEQVH